MWIETLKDLTLGITSDHVLYPTRLSKNPLTFGLICGLVKESNI